MINDSLGEKLKQYRKALKLSQVELGRLIDVSQVTIANYERGERFPKRDKLLAIARIFKITVDELLGSESPLVEEPSFPKDFSYSVEDLIRLLLEESFDRALTYAVSWKAASDFSLLDFYETIITPLMIETGRLWMTGQLLVAEEHLISQKIREIVIITGNREWKNSPSESSKDKNWVGFCSPGEAHSLALLMMGQVLRLQGWNVHYLGTEVPHQDLENMVKKISPQVVSLSTTMGFNNDSLQLILKRLMNLKNSHWTFVIGGNGLQDRKMMDDPRIFKARSITEGVKKITK